jgi:hypothetical protein
MKNSLLLMFLCIALLSSFSLIAQLHKIKGQGEVIKQERNTGDFKEIQSLGSFDIFITDGENHAVHVEAQENLQPYILVEVIGNKLKVRQKKGVHLNTSKSIKIYVTAPALESVQLMGSGNVNGENQLSGARQFDIMSAGSGNISLNVAASSIRAEVSGSGNITLKGKTNELEGKIQGSGNIKAKELQSAITSVKIAGSGSAEVVATEKLNSKIAGSGDVKYWGDASVDSKVVGSGRVHREK